ncbi:MAG: hypothetical protein ACREQW_10065 [Candidatus Binatia bacterium]
MLPLIRSGVKVDAGSIVLQIIVIVILAIIPGLLLRIWLNTREKRKQRKQEKRYR